MHRKHSVLLANLNSNSDESWREHFQVIVSCQENLFFFFLFYAFNVFSHINISEVCDEVASKRLSQNGHFNTTPFCDF